MITTIKIAALDVYMFFRGGFTHGYVRIDNEDE